MKPDWVQTALVALTLVPALATAQGNAECVTRGVYFMAIRGHSYDPDDNDPWNVLAYPRDLLTAQIPGSQTYALPYNFHVDENLPGTIDGSRQLQRAIEQYANQCPNSKIALLGYSQGGAILSNAICGQSGNGAQIQSLPQRYTRNVIAAISWGDFTRHGNEPWNTGTCPAQYNGLTSRDDSNACRPYGASIQNVCDTGDFLCCLGSRAGPAGNPHQLYVYNYSQRAVNFIRQRLQQAGGGVGNSSQTDDQDNGSPVVNPQNGNDAGNTQGGDVGNGNAGNDNAFRIRNNDGNSPDGGDGGLRVRLGLHL